MLKTPIYKLFIPSILMINSIQLCAQRSSLSYDEFSNITLNSKMHLHSLLTTNDVANELNKLGTLFTKKCYTLPVTNVEECTYSRRGFELLTFGGSLVDLTISSTEFFLNYNGINIRLNDDKSKVENLLPGVVQEENSDRTTTLAIYIGAGSTSLIFEYDSSNKIKSISLWDDPS